MPGDFTQEAYEQLRAAYAKETNTQLDAEKEGVKVGGQEMTLETLPVDSPWKTKIDNWEYPTGRSQYLDEKQDPAEILALMRGAAQEQDDAEKLEEAKELVAEAEAEETEEVEETVAETEEISDEDLGEMSDEEFEKYVDELLDGVGDDEELEEVEDEEEEEEVEEEETEEPVAEVEAETEVEEPVAEAEAEEEEAEEETEDEEYDPQAVADEISRLKAELDTMRFVPTEEQPEANDESD